MMNFICKGCAHAADIFTTIHPCKGARWCDCQHQPVNIVTAAKRELLKQGKAVS